MPGRQKVAGSATSKRGTINVIGTITAHKGGGCNIGNITFAVSLIRYGICGLTSAIKGYELEGIR